MTLYLAIVIYDAVQAMVIFDAIQAMVIYDLIQAMVIYDAVHSHILTTTKLDLTILKHYLCFGVYNFD